MVGEEREKIPPPAIRKSDDRTIPRPFLMVKPSRRSVGWKPEAKTTTAHCVEPESAAQKSFVGLAGVLAPWMHGFPVPSIVVTVYPPDEMTETPGRMRTDSLYVPGATETRSPGAAWQIAFWILQYGDACVPAPGHGLDAFTMSVAPEAGRSAAEEIRTEAASRRSARRTRAW